jgi:hypothetical protein
MALIITIVYPTLWKRLPLFSDALTGRNFAPHLAAKTSKENSFLLIRYRENGQRMKKKISGPSIVLLDILKNEF